MSKAIPQICPKCGSTDAYISGRLSGRWVIYYDLENRTTNAESLYEGATVQGGKLIHCLECGKVLGRVEDWDGVGESESFWW